MDRLIEAAEAGDERVIAEAIAGGVALDARDRFGATALLTAAQNGRLAIVQRLIAAGARDDAHAEDAAVKYYLGSNARAELRGRWTLLHAAAMGGADDVVAWLVDERGADPNACDHGGWRPLHVASFYPLARISTLDALLERGADPNAPDALGRNALCRARDSAFVRRLLAAGADPSGGEHVAPVDERVPAVIDGKIVSYPRAESPVRPLERFALEGHAEAVSLLLDHGATSTAGALGAAAFRGDRALVARLASGLDDASVAAALASAADDETFEALLGAMKSVPGEALLVATRSGASARVRAAIARGAPTDARDASGRTALHLAAAAGSEELARLLVERGADAGARDRDGKTPRALAWSQSTPAHEAVRRFLEPITPARAAEGEPAKGAEGATSEGAIAVGERVRHAKFGAGTVVRVEPGDKATVRFDDAGEKTLLSRVLTRE